MEQYQVAPGGRTDFDLGGGVRCTKLSVGSMDNNAYVLTPREGAMVLVDAAAEAGRLLAELQGPVQGIVTTHRHHDHVGALAEVERQLETTVWAGEPDADAIADATGVEVTPLWTGDQIPLGGGFLEVIGLVGHTPGSIALAWKPADGPTHLFTGDSLFPGGVGKTGSADDFASLLGDVVSQLFERFDDHTVVHPGHGRATTLGAERPQLAEWRTRGW